MKLSFSTLGCPDWSWPEIYATAKDLGLQGVEIRGVASEMLAPRIKVFSPENIGATIEKLRALSLEIPMLTSGAVIGDPAQKDEAIDEIKAYIDLAHTLGTPYVRVLIAPGAKPSPADLSVAAEVYETVCAYGQDKGVTPVVETNGPFCDTKLCYEFVRGVQNAGVLWDIHHPFRYHGESVAQSYGNLKDVVRYIHIKDSVMENGRTAYRMLGYGDLPLSDAVGLLHAGGYTGYISLEWVKRWRPGLEDAGIVIPHFVYFMHRLLRDIEEG